MPTTEHGTPPPAGTQDPRTRTGSTHRILAVGLEVSKRVAELPSLDDVYFFLVNDLRVLVDFDRCFVVTHLDTRSRFAAAGNQPVLDTRSKLYGAVNDLAPELKSLTKGLLISGRIDEADDAFKGLPASLLAALTDYLPVSQAKFLFVVPLMHQEVPVAHLMLEFMGPTGPNDLQLLALLHTSPVFGAVLVEKWLLHESPTLAKGLAERLRGISGTRTQARKYFPAALVGCVLLGLGLFLLPVEYTVGGELEIAPWDRNVAFCKMDGLTDTVSVREGAAVRKDQTLAALDPTEIDFRIESSKRELELLSRQAELLELESDRTPAKLGEVQILKLRKRKTQNDLKFHEWQRRFVHITAPVEGIVLTRDVESLAGKKLKAGEPFCEIWIPNDLAAEVLVPEDRVAMTRPGQDMYVYLNNNPLEGHKLRVDMIAPTTEAIPRLGNVCRVRGRFSEVPPSVKVGMKGIGKIHVGAMSLWSILRQRLAYRWNRLSLHF
ncbi:MAG: efflux RND transporter periplasmic adaptor subunit [Thermodesulfobacteriota bacterium]